MAITRKRPKMKRTQICLLPEQLDKATRMARRRGESVSKVMRDLLNDAPESDPRLDDPLFGLIGMVNDADPNGSTTVDEVVYGPDIH
jgi:hypothetical protein